MASYIYSVLKYLLANGISNSYIGRYKYLVERKLEFKGYTKLGRNKVA